MAHFNLRLLVTLCVVLVTVASTTIEIYDGTYYGIEEVDGVTSIQVSSANDGTVSPTGGVPPQRGERPPPPRRHHGHHGRGHHHRGRHGDDSFDGPHHHGPHNYERMSFMRANMMNNWTDEQKLNHVCEHIQRHSPETGRRHGSMLASKLQSLNDEDRQKVIDLWNSRKQEMLRCCRMNSIDEKVQCVNDIRTARYDRVCRGEEPLCPWAQYGSQGNRHGHGHGHGHHFMGNMPMNSDTTTVCCALEGSERLQCFAEAKQIHQRRMMEYWSSRAGMSSSRPGDRRNERPNNFGEDRSSRRGGRRPRPVGTTSSP